MALAQPHDSHTAKSKQALTRPFRRSSIRDPSTIERQTVRFSSRIARSEALPPSLYLINDSRTARDSSERLSGRFGALLYADSPATINAQFLRQIIRLSSHIPRSEALSPPSSLQAKEEQLWSLQNAVLAGFNAFPQSRGWRMVFLALILSSPSVDAL